MKRFTAATRLSRLALAQTQLVAADLKRLRPDIEIVIKKITTSGDRDTSTALWKLEETGFFTSQLESALLNREADFAVHSFKDLPTSAGEGLTIAALCRREFVEDILVANKFIHSIQDLSAGAKIGTSSLRRRAQIKHIRPDIEPVTIRGNVETRIKKVDNGEMDAVILARAGLERLGLAKRINQVFEPTEFLPAPGQGTLAVQARADDGETIELAALLDDAFSRISSLAEREVLAIMEGGCHAPIGAYANINGKRMSLFGFVSDLEGSRYVKRFVEGQMENWQSLARQLADELLDAGGRQILEELKS
jgi:hydroxymethylbilane synthase